MRRVVMRAVGTIATAVLLSYYLPGFRAENAATAIVAGAILAAVYVVFVPVARVLLGVFNVFSLGIVGVVVDAAIVMLAISRVPGCTVDGFPTALEVAVAINVVRFVIGLVVRKRR